MGSGDHSESIPSGVVTFLFTDVEGSTRHWAADSDAMAASLRVHDDLVRSAIADHHGYVFTTAGDAFCAAFQRASDAVAAARAAQATLTVAAWPGPTLKVRMGIHLGEAVERSGDFFGPTVNTAARVEAAGHGGQILVTDAVRSAVGLDATDLGAHDLRDVPEPVHLWQLGDGEFPQLRTSGSRTNVPTPATRLVGRVEDVRAVRLLLAEHRLVTLVAVGGIGKTRLAIEVAEAEAAHWRDGVWFVDLTPVNSDDDVARSVAKALRLELRSDESAAEVARYVAGRELMIVLDNCEHVIDACADLATHLLRAGGTSVILATSREWLDIDGERVFQVRSLDTEGRESPAVTLFLDRASAVAPDFAVDEQEWATISELCRRLDGVPLAIELAASRAAVMSPARLVEGLDDRFRLLSGGRRRQRHRTLEATIDWSYDLLEPEEQQTFRALGAFAGSFDVEAVAAVCEVGPSDAIDLVEALYTRSLVAPAGDTSQRFHLLETLKAYAEDRLVDAGEADAVRERHARHFAHRAETADLTTARNLERCVRLLPDLANLLLAADRFESERRWDELAEHLFGMAFVSGEDSPAMISRIQRCAARVSRQELIDGLTQAEVFCTMALADWVAYTDAAARLRRSPDPRTAAHGYLLLTLVTGRHAPDQARSLVDRFVAMVGDPSDRDIADEATLWRAMVAAMEGDLEAARTLAAGVAQSPVGRTSLGLNATMIRGVAGWAAGEPAELGAIIDRIEAAHGSSAAMDPFYAHVLGFGRALMALASGDLESARAAVRRESLDAASGRVTLIDGDALALLAEHARLEGDTDHARELIMDTGPGRSPPTIGAIRHIAKTLDVDEELHAAYCANMLDQEWMVDRPKRTLTRELDRRGWVETP